MRRAIIAFAALALAGATPAMAAPTATSPGGGLASYTIFSYTSSDFYDLILSGTFPMGSARPFVGDVKQTQAAGAFSQPAQGPLRRYRTARIDIVGVPTVGTDKLTGWCFGSSRAAEPADVLVLRCRTFRAGVEHDVRVVITAYGEGGDAPSHGIETSYVGTYAAYAVS